MTRDASPTTDPNESEREGTAAKPVDTSPVDDFQMPIETEIYLLPDGQVVVADLPAELLPLIESIGQYNSSCQVGKHDSPSDQSSEQ